MSNKLRVLDLFSGIGGFSVGLEAAGYETVAFCEIDEDCRAVLRKHWPSVPVFEDVAHLNKEVLDAKGIKLDVICGGFPCQDISLAGEGAGLAGERSGLWYEFHRLIQETGPSAVIIENVSALRSRGLDEVLSSLAQIGYDAEWHCIPAQAVGAPHARDRLWIVAYPNHERLQRYAGDGNTRNGWKDAPRPTATESVLRRTDACGWWGIESSVGRVVDGIPKGLDRRRHTNRLKQLGNAVVPQIPEMIGRAIMERLFENGKA